MALGIRFRHPLRRGSMTTRVLAIALSVLVATTGFAAPKKKAKQSSKSKSAYSRSSKRTASKSKSKSRKSVEKTSSKKSSSYVAKKPATSRSNGPAPLGRATLSGKNVAVRQSPSSESALVTRVTGGNVAVIAKSGDWYKLRFQYGSVGWVKENFVVMPDKVASKSSKPAEKVAKSTEPERITVSNVSEPKTEVAALGAQYTYIRAMNTNVRRGPSSTNSVITKVSGGKAEILDKWGDWYKLKFQYGTVGWVRSDMLTNNPKAKVEGTNYTVASVPATETVERVLKSADTFRGVRYNYGSASRSATDCSGFTLQVFRQNGISLPRTAREQVHAGVPVKRTDLQPGDLVFFNTRGYVSHVGIYTGNGKFIHASSGKGRVIESPLSGYYSSRYITARRVIKGGVKKIELPKVDVVEKERPVTSDDDGGEYKIDIASGSAAIGN